MNSQMNVRFLSANQKKGRTQNKLNKLESSFKVNTATDNKLQNTSTNKSNISMANKLSTTNQAATDSKNKGISYTMVDSAPIYARKRGIKISNKSLTGLFNKSSSSKTTTTTTTTTSSSSSSRSSSSSSSSSNSKASALSSNILSGSGKIDPATERLHRIALNKEIQEQEQRKRYSNLNSNQIHWSGWVKFFKYNSNKGFGTVTNFFKNNEFKQQLKRNARLDLKEKDKEGKLINIPDETSFYASLFKDSLVFRKARSSKGGFSKIFDVLNLQFMDNVMENSFEYIGGMEDIGTNTEGECFKIFTHIAKEGVTWAICLEEEIYKNSLMKNLRNLRIDRQREAGIVYVPEISRPLQRETLQTLTTKREDMLIDPEKRKQFTGGSAKDGYWQVLQDWTECNLKCGGGNSTLQRICVPPISDGKPCDGNPILIRKCNTQPCPHSNMNQYYTAENESKAAVVKVVPFSDKPQRYEKCIVKESDLIMIDRTSGVDMNIPVRVVLNNSTFSAFSGFKFSDLRYSFNLQKARLLSSMNYKNCFELQQTEKLRAIFCDFGMESSPNFYAEWHYDYNLFKYQCHEVTKSINITFAQNMTAELDKKKDQLKADILLKRQMKSTKEQEDHNELKKQGDIALQALNKEMDVEKLLEEEELQREKEEALTIDYKVNSEKKKEDCIVKAIKEREQENQFNQREKGKAEELDNLKQATKKQITMRREYLKKRLANLRKRAEKKNEIKKQQIMTIRLEVADKLSKAYRKGSIATCLKATTNNLEWNSFCTGYFMTDYGEMEICKKVSQDRCHFCCEKEFGDLFIEEREKCVQQSCAPKMDSLKNGRWVWKKETMREFEQKQKGLESHG
eukprot:CAMPEP_0170517082 /NCGR_PEP_ID=MMETSP0209-20121228/3172_1 /TAXON_ID=665100 ORGANISM="Litonotus pictus, Strain P1" /NCGR_SAMPLE_ID=MMETSP0209 /ASSEMBLY_ACC=CAM_ASM_000301 /LENGTH=851 /DNA_ID=CAMNT_0010802235 /DNA_START=163 /DNA_END=2714 /DNA_ORIENTATION=+